MNMVSRKMGILFAAALAVMPHNMRGLGQRTLAGMGLADESKAYVPSSQNGGRKVRGNRHVQRAAIKAKNVRRFRRASKGRA